MSLKSFFKKITSFFSKLFHSLLPELKEAVKFGVVLVNKIKEFDAAHPEVADVLTAIIPGDWDDKLKERVRAELPKILVELKLVDSTLGLSDNEIVLAGIKALTELSARAKAPFLNSLSQLIAQVAADGKLDWDDVVYLEKWVYDHPVESGLTP